MDTPLIEREAPHSELPVTLGGKRYVLTHPASLSFQEILTALSGPPGFLAYVLVDEDVAISSAQLASLRDLWVEHHGLLIGPHLTRLHWLIEKNFEALEYDFAATLPGQSIHDLWHGRHWRTLLNLIDHLPRTSHYSQAVSNDPEYAQMIAEALVSQEDDDDSSKVSGPPLTIWTPEYEAMQAIHNTLRSLTWLVENQKAKTLSKRPEQLPVPSTAITRAIAQAKESKKRSKHDERVAMLLPHKKKA